LGQTIDDYKKPTTGIKEECFKKAFDSLLNDLKNNKDKWQSYDWFNKVIRSNHLLEALSYFGIKTQKEDNLYFLRFQNCYRSDYFETLMDLLSDSMSDGVMLFRIDRADLIALYFRDGEVDVFYGKEAKTVYIHDLALKEKEEKEKREESQRNEESEIDYEL